jgi:hypothetical protein
VLLHERHPGAPHRARREGHDFLSFARRAAAAAILLAARVTAAEPPSAAERAACLRLLETTTETVGRSVLRFEKTGGRGPEAIRAAREVLAEAYAARDRLEGARVSGFCEPSHREELVYLNHLTLGFTGWLEARSRRPPADYDVSSIVRRARVHQARGRARLASGRNL